MRPNLMDVNAEGHIVLASGQTTEPGKKGFYIGSEVCFITFSYMLLPDGQVAVHSALHDEGELEPVEDFLYEVVARHEALRCAETMVNDALEYLESLGVELDLNPTPEVFLQKLQAEINNRLH